MNTKKTKYKDSKTASAAKSRLLYIHIPFCDSKCNYCAFNSYTNINHLKNEYFPALKKQFNTETKSGSVYETVFIGGGTPSTMNPAFYEKLFSMMEPFVKKGAEITVECNPNTSLEWLKNMRAFGVNRISFGIQSFNDAKLRFLNRNHSSKQALKSVKNAVAAGFENINIDLIYSTALDTREILQKDLEIAFSLPLSHISAYSLSIEKNTPWENDFTKRKYDEELEIWFINSIKQKHPQYEISNFGKKCLHNLGYWQGKEYTGIGAGAVGFKKEEKIRYYTQNDVYGYIKNPLIYRTETLGFKELKEESVFLGLRSVVGFDKNILNENEKKRVQVLINEKKLFEKNGKVLSYDFLLADALSAYILD